MKKSSEKIWLGSYPEGVPRELSFSEKRLDDVLEEAALEFGSKTALVFYSRELSYARLNRLCDRFAASLQGRGVEKGDRVALLLPNSIQFVVAFYGALRAGAVPVPLNPLYTERELRGLFKDCRPRAAVSLRGFSSRLEEAAEEGGTKILFFTRLERFLPFPKNLLYKIKNLPRDLVWLLEGGKKGMETKNFARLFKEEGKEPERVGVDPSRDLAVLIYTSGTTGRPKGVKLTHSNLLANLAQIRAFTDPVLERTEEVQLGVLPFFHIYGLNFVLNFSLSQGYEVVLLPEFHTSLTCRAIEKHEVSIVAGVPAIFSALFGEYERTNGGVDFSSLKFCGSGAAPCPVSLIRKMKKITEAVFIEAYGLTETSPLTHMNPPSGEQKEGSVGIPLPGTEAKIVEPESGKRLSAGSSGELLLKGPQVSSGYWENEKVTKEAFEKGWLRTGDIGRVDEEGFLYIQGRLDDMINVSGKKVWPREIEDVLSRHAGVEEAAVIGVPDKRSGQAPKAFVVPRLKGLEKKKVTEFCEERLVDYKVPKEVEVVSDIPKSAVGKTLHHVLRKRGGG